MAKRIGADDFKDVVLAILETDLDNEECAEVWGNLTKAKEIIKELLLLPYANNEEVYADVTSTLDKAEQFIKEIEK